MRAWPRRFRRRSVDFPEPVSVAHFRIRDATEADRDAIWKIFHEVVAAGDTYAIDPDISREDALAYWFASGTHTYVAEQKAVEEAYRQRTRSTSGRDVHLESKSSRRWFACGQRRVHGRA